MKTTNVLLIMVLSLALTACANWPPSPEVSAEYQRGYDLSWEYAKKDAMKYDCYNYRLRTSRPVGIEYQYHDSLRKQGKSENFIRGFKFGYIRYFSDFVELYCGK
jgi:hypothetical protein